MALPREHLTLEEFLKLPEEEPALEYEEGRVTQKVSPKGKHGLLQPHVWQFFSEAAKATGSAIAFTELRTSYGGRSYVPDVSVYRRERVPADENGRFADDFREPPDLVAEIVSPEQSVMKLVRRCLWYVAHGVRAALLLDPSDDSILVFRPNQIPLSLDEDEEAVLGDVIPGLKFRAETIFNVLKIHKCFVLGAWEGLSFRAAARNDSPSGHA